MITDQTTKPRRFSRRKKWLILGGALLSALFVLSRFATKTNVARTDENDADTRLHPRVYSESPARVSQEIRALVPQLRTYGRAWKMEQRGRQKENVFYIAVPVLVFTDDLTVTLSPQNDGASTRVEVRSASCVGKGDFGENRRHVIQFLTALDARLK